MTAPLLTLLIACRHVPGDKAPATDTGAMEGGGPDTDHAGVEDSTSTADSGNSDTGLPPCAFSGPLPELEPCTDCTFVDIAVMTYGWCGIYTDGTLGCWLSNVVSWGDSPLYDSLPSGTYTSIAAGDERVCAIREDGRICCVSDIDLDEEDGWHEPPTSPAARIELYGQDGCVVMVDGTVQCFGFGLYGAPSEAPVEGIYTQVEIGVFHACALAADGHVDCWGIDDEGWTDDEYNWGQVDDTPETTGFTSVWTNYFTNCALKAAGEATCWGQAGTEAEEALAPYAVKMVQIGGTICAITTDDALVCLNTPSEDWGNPTEGTWSKVQYAPLLVCALSTEGRVVCWGGHGEDLSPIYTTE